MSVMRAAYDEPTVYDLLHSPGTAREVDGLERIFRRWSEGAAARGLKERRSPRRVLEPACGTGRYLRLFARHVLEPACGTGRYLRLFARRGWQVAGFDRDPGMVAFALSRLTAARGRGGHRPIFVADMDDFAGRLKAATVDFAFNLHNTIRHLGSDAALARHLAGMGRVLRPGAIYAVGLSLTRYGDAEITEDVWHAVRGRRRVTQLVQYLPPDRTGPRRRWETVIAHTTVEDPGAGIRHSDTMYRLRCYDREEWQRLIARSPFTEVAVVDGRGEPIDVEQFEYGIHLLRRG